MGLFAPLLRRARRDALTALGGAPPVMEGPVRGMGLVSGGAGTLRGLGHLAVAEHAIAFTLCLPRRTLTIPRDAVLGLDTTRTHAGRASSRPFLRVRFTDPAGHEDAVAFDVPRGEADRWLAALRAD